MSLFSKYDPFFVGFDNIFSLLETFGSEASQLHKFPPYNIVRESEDRYVIEMALAGWGSDDIEASLSTEGVLTVRSKPIKVDDDTRTQHRGIAKRAFTRSFTLAPTMRVEEADLKNGMLTIKLRNDVPKPRVLQIPIGSQPVAALQSLQEEKVDKLAA